MPPPADRSEAETLARTTVRLPRPLLKRARIRCVTDELTLQSLVAFALETELDRRDKAEQRQTRRAASADQAAAAKLVFRPSQSRVE